MGQGTNGFKPVTNEASAPDPLFSADAVQLSVDNKLLFVCNAGDNSVSSFVIQEDGTPRFADRKSTGEDGAVMSLAYNEAAGVLTASHAFGPAHLTQFTVSANGDLALMPTTDPVAEIPGNGFASLAGIPTSGPGDIWMDSEGRVYQLFANASVLVAFQADAGNLREIGRYQVPLNSVQGLKGF